MTWTYSGDPASVARDAVRFLIGDTDTTDQQVNDAEIAFALTQNSNQYEAAMICVAALVAKYARQVDSQIESISESASQRVTQYNALMATLKLQSANASGGVFKASPIITGASESANLEKLNQIDLTKPAFYPSQFDNTLPVYPYDTRTR